MRRLLMALMVCGSCLLVVHIVETREGIASRVGEQGRRLGGTSSCPSLPAPARLEKCTGSGASKVCAFEQVHIAIGEYDKREKTWSMVISWATARSNALSKFPSVRVAAAATPACETRHAATTTSYHFEVCDDDRSKFTTKSNEDYDSPDLHHAVVRGLRPQEVYTYRVGSEPTAAGSGTVVFREDRFSFRVPPIPGDEWEHSEAMTLLTVGDIGQTENSERTLEALRHRFEDQKAGTVAGLIIGDMSYADGGADRWDSWGRLVEPLFSSLPLHVLPGNHEVEVSKSSLETFQAYRHRFQMPSSLPEKISHANAPHKHHSPWWNYDLSYEGGSSYYSFDAGLMHIICLNAYDVLGAKRHQDGEGAMSAQEKFLSEDLLAVDRRRTPFVVVFMHNPIYNSNSGHQNEKVTLLIQESAEPYFDKHNVDIVLAGHVHAYERHGHIGLGGRQSAKSPMYVTIGDGGNHELLYDKWLKKPSTSIVRDSRFYGHGELTAFNRTHLRWTWIPNPVQGKEATKDEVWVRQDDDEKGGGGTSATIWIVLGIVVVGAFVAIAAASYDNIRPIMRRATGSSSQAFASLVEEDNDEEEEEEEASAPTSNGVF